MTAKRVFFHIWGTVNKKRSFSVYCKFILKVHKVSKIHTRKIGILHVKNCLRKIKAFHTKYIRLFPNIVFSCLCLILHAFPAVPLQSAPKKTTQNFTGCQTLDHQFCHQLLQTTTAVAVCCFTVPSTGQCRVEHSGTRSVVDGPPYRGEDGAKECLNLIELGGTLKEFSGGGWG